MYSYNDDDMPRESVFEVGSYEFTVEEVTHKAVDDKNQDNFSFKLNYGGGATTYANFSPKRVKGELDPKAHFGNLKFNAFLKVIGVNGGFSSLKELEGKKGQVIMGWEEYYKKDEDGNPIKFPRPFNNGVGAFYSVDGKSASEIIEGSEAKKMLDFLDMAKETPVYTKEKKLVSIDDWNAYADPNAGF